MTQPERIAKGLYWDRAWSLVGGCSNVSPGCDNCWAAREAHTRAGQQNQKIRNRYTGLTTAAGRWNGQIRMLDDNLDLPMRIKKPTVWAVWNDLFHEKVHDGFILDAFARMEFANQHTFLILTKRADRMLEFFNTYEGNGWPLPNVILLVTVENQEQANLRLPLLIKTPAAARGVSVEPMLGSVDVSLWFYSGYIEPPYDDVLDWVICGGESGPGARPVHPEWVRDLRDQCVSAGVPYFFKQWGEWAPWATHLKGVDGPWDCYINLDGSTGQCAISGMDHATWLNWSGNPKDGLHIISRAGKKAAGRLLDGREWNEMPVCVREGV